MSGGDVTGPGGGGKFGHKNVGQFCKTNCTTNRSACLVWGEGGGKATTIF